MVEKSLAVRGVPTFKDKKQVRGNQRGTDLGEDLKESQYHLLLKIILEQNVEPKRIGILRGTRGFTNNLTWSRGCDFTKVTKALSILVSLS
jgi:hypothetical protein